METGNMQSPGFIAGIVSSVQRSGVNPMEDENAVAAMARMLSYRGPRYFIQSDKAVALVGDCAPIEGQGVSRDILLVHTGHIFEKEQLAAALSLPGETHEVMLLEAAYLRWQEGFLEKVKGEFSLALFDRGRKKLILARDRVGMEPLFYAHEEGCFVFASEAKAVALNVKARSLHYPAAHCCLDFSAVYTREHLIRGICELRAGYMLSFDQDSDSCDLTRYWDREFNISKHSFSYFAQGFKEVLSGAVKRCLPPEGEKVAVSLSGGIDSSLITALASRFHRGPIETINMTAQGDEASEGEDARLVSQCFHTRHHEVSLSVAQALQYLPQVLWHTEECIHPFLFAVALSMYAVGICAREQGCIRILTGNGIEHNFDGNPQQRELYKFFAHSRMIPDVIRDVFFSRLPARIKMRISYSWSSSQIDDLAAQYESFNGYPEARLFPCYAEVFLQGLKGFCADRIFKEYLAMTSSQEYFNKLLYLDFKTWNSRRNLVINDRLFSASGLDVRIPFLDAEVLEFSSTMPVEFKHNFRKNKYFILKVFGDLLPARIREKGKHTSVPNFDFFEEEHKPLIFRFARAFAKRGIIRQEKIEALLASRLKGSGRDMIFMCFAFELWHRIFIDNPGIRREDLTLEYLDAH